MQARGLFIPGLFVSPGSMKYRALSEALKPKARLHFLDFKPVYKNKFSYSDLLQHAASRLDTDYDFVIAHCMGCNLYRDAIAQKANQEKKKSILITPAGKICNSIFWEKHADLADEETIYYQPNNYYPKGYNVEAGFYREMDVFAQKNNQKFCSNTSSLLAKEDIYVSKDIRTELHHAGCDNIVVIEDDHGMKKEIPSIIYTTKSFLIGKSNGPL